MRGVRYIGRAFSGLLMCGCDMSDDWMRGVWCWSCLVGQHDAWVDRCTIGRVALEAQHRSFSTACHTPHETSRTANMNVSHARLCSVLHNYPNNLFPSFPLTVPSPSLPASFTACALSFNSGKSKSFVLAPGLLTPLISFHVPRYLCTTEPGKLAACAVLRLPALNHVNAPTQGWILKFSSRVPLLRDASWPEGSVIWYFGL